MTTLYHQPFCPHSRFIRIAIAEYGVDVRLVEERPWDRREAFLALNPPRTTPVLTVEDFPAIPGAHIIAEHLDGTSGAAMGERRLLPEDRAQRIEVRRLTSWVTDTFCGEVCGLLATGRGCTGMVGADRGGGSPDSHAIRAARHNIRYRLAYMEWLLRTRDWLAGDRLSYADLAAAAQLSIADYLGDVP